MRNKWIWALVAMMMISTVFLGGCSKSQPEIGVVDMAKVMNESPKIKQTQDQLQAKVKELTEDLDKAKASGITPEEFQKKQEAAQNEFMNLRQTLEGQVEATMKQTFEQVAKDKKLSVILYKNSVAQGGVDITEDVMKKLQ